MKPFPDKIQSLHFVGIGGIGMSGLAEIAQQLGLQVQGSDQSEGLNVERLRAKNIEIFIGHKPENLKTQADKYPQAVIVSSAINENNPEIIEAKKRHIPIVRRADFLAQLMRLKWSIGIAGTHGKTTTTSLVGHILSQAGMDPTVVNGGIINSLGTNVRLGKGEWMVAETDESDGSFEHLPITIGLITNIDPEHLDHYGGFDALKTAFTNFASSVPFYGAAVLCIDNEEVTNVLPLLNDKRVITYGLSPQANMRAVNIESQPDITKFDLHWKNGNEAIIKDIHLALVGEHNVQNACGAAAIAYDLGVEPQCIKEALENFQGVKRRFTKTGEVAGITIIDDYGHHPTEIRAVLKAARQSIANRDDAKVIAVMQPHRYTRLRDHFSDFCTCMHDADLVYISNVYEANEAPIEGYNRDSLVDGLREAGHRDAHALNAPSDLPDIIRQNAKQGDIVMFLGAGSVSTWANELPTKLAKLFPNVA